MKQVIVVTWALVVSILLVAAVTEAAAGTIRGRIVDSDGVAVDEAFIVLTAPDGSTSTAETRSDGGFLMEAASAGAYWLRVSALGFKDLEQKVTVADGAALDLDIALELATFQGSITVVGTRVEMDVAEYPGSVTVVEDDDLLDSSSLIENLDKVPGFETGGGQGRNIGQQFTIRGFGYQSEERVIIKQDGVRRSANLFSNHISTFRTEPEILKQVDVVKGSSSISHGGGAIGGVVGMTTKDAFDYLEGEDEFAAQVNARYESNNHYSLSLAAAGNPGNGRFSYLLFAKRGHTDDLEMADSELDDVQNDEDIDTGFVKLGYKISDSSKISLSYFDLNEEIETVWQTVYHSQYPTDGPVIGELSQEDWVLSFDHDPADNQLIDLSATLYHSEGYYDRTADYQSIDVLVDYKNGDEVSGLGLQNIAHFTTGGVRHRLVVGADYYHREEDATYVNNGETFDFGSMPNDYKDMGLYFQDDIFLLDDRVMLLLGGRYDRFERNVDGVDAEYDESRFSPRVGISAQVTPSLRLLGNYSEAFRAPTPHETSSIGPLNPHYWYLPNPELDPETSSETELGFAITRDGLFGRNAGVTLKGMYFFGTIDDMIAFDVLPELGESPDGSPYGTYMNVEKAKRKGFEVEARLFAGGWSFDATFEHLDMYSSVSHEKVPNGFADKARLAISYTFVPLNLTLGGEVSHWFEPDQSPESFFFRGEEYFYVREEFTIANLRLRWKPQGGGLGAFFGRSFEVHLGVNNVFNDTYINSRNVETTSRSGKGRNVFLNLSKRF